MKIPVNIFRKTGKWYTEETIEVPDDTETYLIRDAVKENRRIKDMITVATECNDRNDFVPFLVPADGEKEWKSIRDIIVINMEKDYGVYMLTNIIIKVKHWEY